MSSITAEFESRTRQIVALVGACLVLAIGWVVSSSDADILALATSLNWASAHDRWVHYFSYYSPYPFYVVFAVALFVGWRRKRRDVYVVALGYWLALVLGALVTVRVLKVLVGHARPDTGAIAGQWLGPHLNNAYHSFPSGHTTDVFIGAIFLSLLLPAAPWRVAVVAYAVTAAAARVVVAKHYPIDVIAGGCLALLYAYVVIYFWMPRRLRLPSSPTLLPKREGRETPLPVGEGKG